MRKEREKVVKEMREEMRRQIKNEKTKMSRK